MTELWYHGKVNATNAENYTTGKARIEDPGLFLVGDELVFQMELSLAVPVGNLRSSQMGYRIPDLEDVKALLKQADLIHTSGLEGKLVNLYVTNTGKLKGISF